MVGFQGNLGFAILIFKNDFIKEINNNRSSVLDYEITIEATHHGPTSLKKPLLFIEIGSTEKQWADTQRPRLSVTF